VNTSTQIVEESFTLKQAEQIIVDNGSEYTQMSIHLKDDLY
jgi:hypothetical protein